MHKLRWRPNSSAQLRSVLDDPLLHVPSAVRTFLLNKRSTLCSPSSPYICPNRLQSSSQDDGGVGGSETENYWMVITRRHTFASVYWISMFSLLPPVCLLAFCWRFLGDGGQKLQNVTPGPRPLCRVRPPRALLFVSPVCCTSPKHRRHRYVLRVLPRVLWDGSVRGD